MINSKNGTRNIANLPKLSSSWQNSFRKRNLIKLQFTKEVVKEKYVSTAHVHTFFDYLDSLNLANANPHLIFNCGLNIQFFIFNFLMKDETHLTQKEKRTRVCSKKGDKPVVSIIKKQVLPQHVTLMACISAKPSSESVMKTLVVLPCFFFLNLFFPK